MKELTNVLAFDFGASSGRAIKATYNGKTLQYKEIHRFENIPVEKDGFLCWNLPQLKEEILCAISKAGTVDSLAFDTWGVDYGLIDKQGFLVKLPVHYRDERTKLSFENAFKNKSKEWLYEKTGNQLMPLNTLFQLMTEKINQGDKVLFMPDLFGYLLSGKMYCEATIASTSQLLSPITKSWDKDILIEYGIDIDLFPPIINSGTIIKKLDNDVKLIAVAGHDTQCAVAAMPSIACQSAFISCGTWSLIGCEIDKPILSAESFKAELSNELGANEKVNYLKNIIGLWLIQESRRSYRRNGEDYSFAQLEELALSAEPFKCFIDPDAPEFISPGDIPEKIKEYCTKTGQYVPKTVGEVVRCIYESLAFKYKLAINQLKNLTEKQFEVIHILGGGTKDKLLCQMTANATGVMVKAGPIEATALGNIIIQLVALNKLENINAGRKLILEQENIYFYNPINEELWENAYSRFIKVINGGEK